MDASHPVRAEHGLPTKPVSLGEGGEAIAHVVGVAKGEVDPRGPTASKCPRWKIRRSSQANRRVRDEY